MLVTEKRTYCEEHNFIIACTYKPKITLETFVFIGLLLISVKLDIKIFLAQSKMISVCPSVHM